MEANVLDPSIGVAHECQGLSPDTFVVGAGVDNIANATGAFVGVVVVIVVTAMVVVG